MDFFKKKIKKYQEQKLDEILFKIQFHQSTKNELEEKLNKLESSNEKLTKDISYHTKKEFVLVDVKTEVESRGERRYVFTE